MAPFLPCCRCISGDATFIPAYKFQSNSVDRGHWDLNTMLLESATNLRPAGKKYPLTFLLALHSVIHKKTVITLFTYIYIQGHATPLDVLYRFPNVPTAADVVYVPLVEGHHFKAHHLVKAQMKRAIPCSALSYRHKQNSIQERTS